jgi:hypothetical protein
MTSPPTRALLWFLAGLVGLDLLIHLQRDTWARYCPDEYRERLARCRDTGPDLVAIGGSPVTEGLVPELLSGVRIDGRPRQRVVNFGLTGATASEVRYAVKNGVRTTPAVLLYGATASDINDSRHEPLGPTSLMTWADLADWAWHRPASAEWVLRHFVQRRIDHCWKLYHHRHAMRLWLADQAEARWPGSFPETAREARAHLAHSADLRRTDAFAPNPGGRVYHYDEIKARLGRPAGFGFLMNYRVGEHLQQIHRLLDECRQRSVKVIVVDMPVTVDLSDRLYPGEFALYHEALAEIERAHGIRVVRGARQGAGLTDHDFADLIHLNAGGARKLSCWLRGQLEDSTGLARGRSE